MRAKQALCVLVVCFGAVCCLNQNVLQKLHQGCIPDVEGLPDVDFLVHESSNNQVEDCLAVCREQGYTFAGLRAGTECRCGDRVMRQSNETDDCSVPCPGYNGLTCGGLASTDVYTVPNDDRYLGCWHDSNENYDLTLKLWSNTEQRSAIDCIQACKVSGYKFAGVQNGGDCYCGDSYGNHGEAEENKCNVGCHGWSNQNCGGSNQNAIYVTGYAYNIAEPPQDEELRVFYSEDENMAGISTTLFLVYPKLRSIISPRLTIHVSGDVKATFEADACLNDCYQPCGNIYHPAGLTNAGNDIILRFFHLNLSDLPNYVGQYAERVYIYAQTVFVDTEFNVPYALLLRTRLLIIDYANVKGIQVNPDSPLLDMNEDVKDVGPAVDLLFQKQSYICSRILLDTREPQHINTALSIIYDIVNEIPQTDEQAGYVSFARMYRSEILGIIRSDVRFIPFYSKKYIGEIMEIYQSQIEVYKNEYNKLVGGIEDGQEYVNVIRNMLTIHATTNIYEASIEYQNAVLGLRRSNSTYFLMYTEFNRSRIDLEISKQYFEENLEKYSNQGIFGAALDFIRGAAQMAFGFVQIFMFQTAERGAANVKEGISGMANSMTELAAMLAKIDRMMAVVDELLLQLQNMETHYDYLRHASDIEMNAQLTRILTEWRILKDNAMIIVDSEEILPILGSIEYRGAFLDFINWGEGLTKSMVELAENYRLCIAKKYLLDSKLEQSKQLQDMLQQLEDDLIDQEAMTIAMSHQYYDISCDLNDLLITFCQAYFYENLNECSSSYKASFGGTLESLLLKIYLARGDSIFNPDPGSNVRRWVDVVDEDVSPNCTDATVCPINYLKQHGVFYLTLDYDRWELNDLEKYRVKEIRLDFIGAKDSNPDCVIEETYPFCNLLTTRIQSAGTFGCKYRGVEYDFITRALDLTFQYHVVSGEITMYADVYEEFQSVVQHITPYTTWVLRISERSQDIDLSQVTMVRIRMDGSAIDAEGSGQPGLDLNRRM